MSRIKEENPASKNVLEIVIDDFIEKIHSKESFILSSMA